MGCCCCCCCCCCSLARRLICQLCIAIALSQTTSRFACIILFPLFQCKVLGKGNVLVRESRLLSTPFTIVEALRLVLGDEPFRTRRDMVVIHLVGWAPSWDDMGLG